MLHGTLVIANDLLGFVVNSAGDMLEIRDKEGCSHAVRADVCHEVCNPHALALLTYRKLTHIARNG